MIEIGRISDVGERFDENWLVVRSLKNGVPNGARQVSLLSPSKSLFYGYLDAKRSGQFNDAWFQEHYVPVFIRELIAQPDALALMDQLYRDSFHKDILLACFCTDETLCHRSILAGMLLGAGAQIRCSADYIRYHRMFLEIAKG